MRTGLCMFAALVGWLALTAQNQASGTQSQQPKAEVNQAQTAPAPSQPANTVEQVESAELYRPCNEGEDARNSDLCAQWKAADAAADAARWTSIGNWIGGISGLLVLVAIGLAYHANWIARDTAKRQLRAYLYVQMHDLPSLAAGQAPAGKFWLKNAGQTPANDVCLANVFVIGLYPFAGDPPPIPEDGIVGGSSMAPGDKVILMSRWDEVLTEEMAAEIKAGVRRIVMYGEIRYKDVFGDAHVTRWRASYGGAQLIDAEAVEWEHPGNDAD